MHCRRSPSYHLAICSLAWGFLSSSFLTHLCPYPEFVQYLSFVYYLQVENELPEKIERLVRCEASAYQKLLMTRVEENLGGIGAVKVHSI